MNYQLASAFRYLKKTEFGFFFINNWLRPGIDVSDIRETDKVIAHIQRSIEQAKAERSKILYPGGYDILYLPGMSSTKGRHLLNNLFSVKNACHLEIGSWKGSTLISSKYRNTLRSTSIDNWSQFSGPKNEFLDTIDKYGIPASTKIIDQDCFTVDLKKEFSEKVQLYFFDGEHSYLSQYKAFTYYNDILDDRFITVVDDYNIDEVQKGTQDAFKELSYKVLYENYLPSAFNGDMGSWWNGLYIAYIEKHSKKA